MTARKPLTRTETILILQRQATGPILCGCGCGEPLEPVNEKVIDEHGLARKLCEPGSEADRDALENRCFYRWPCAMEKTRKDLAQIAKAKAQAGETGQYARRQRRGEGAIQSRGFDKSKTRGFDGKVRLRRGDPTALNPLGGDDGSEADGVNP